MTTINVSKLEWTYQTFQSKSKLISVDCNHVYYNESYVPEYYDYYSGMFSYCRNLKTVTNLPNVISMSYAFSRCSNLTTPPIIPNSVTNMYYAFEDCYNLTSIPSIPNSVTNLDSCFEYCNKLTSASSLIVSNSMVNMRDCFYSCKNLTTPPNMDNAYNLIDIYGCFSNCQNLTSAPNLYNCINLTQISSLFQNCSKISGPIYMGSPDISDYAYAIFNNTSASKDFYIPFGNCHTYRYLTETYNYSTTSRINGAILKEHPGYTTYNNEWYYNKDFYKLASYVGSNKDVSIPTHLGEHEIESYSKYIVEGNPNIESVDMINLTNINSISNMFENCVNLKYVYNISNNVSNASWAFGNCYNLSDNIILPSSIQNMSATFWNCSSFINAPVIPNGVVNMNSAFRVCHNLVNAPVIPNSVNDLQYAFTGCDNLVNAPVIPNGVVNMYATFWNCHNLVNVPKFPDSIKSLPYTFNECTNLNNIDMIPNSIKSLAYTFRNCYNLRNISSMENYVDLTTMAATFINCHNLTSFEKFPQNVETLNSAFVNCSNLTSIPNIPNKVTSLYQMFDGCINLTGNIFIESENISNISSMFKNTSLNKDVYIKMKTSEPQVFPLICYTYSYYNGDTKSFYADHVLGSSGEWSEYNVPVYDVNGSRLSQYKFEYYKMPEMGDYAEIDVETDDYSETYWGLVRNVSGDVNAIIPAGSYTTTYNTFINAGYSNSSRAADGVQLFDIDSVTISSGEGSGEGEPWQGDIID